MDQCVTQFDAVSMAPVEFGEPQPDWIKAKDDGIIPASVFSLYCRANFLSFNSGSNLFADKKLFGYFSMVLGSLKQNLVDADKEIAHFETANALVYDPGKLRRGETFTPEAHELAKKHFQMLMFSLFASLDCVADLTALMLTDEIKGLKVGKAMFQRMEDWLSAPPPKLGVIVSPQQAKARELYDQLKPIATSQGEETDWLPLARLLRDKAAHLGSVQFREMGVSDQNGVYYTFLPKRWPMLWEEQLEVSAAANRPASRSTMDNYLQTSFMRQDKITFVRGLRAKVTSLVDVALIILDSAYHEFKDFNSNKAAIDQLEGSAKEFAFEAFQEQ